ncbi:hypothetical protein GCM10023194_20760 [Planotetraspora phitsanulokensis]|uniref:Uncharacterized protein n=1 Tax=Planotetraspora phitsanulokensis TaxID=575192 RepID=A0A8J3U642_9ACTN|nr:hypothetical protein Pph01_42960 [Planotetraspora phitsanulokensis]
MVTARPRGAGKGDAGKGKGRPIALSARRQVTVGKRRRGNTGAESRRAIGRPGIASAGQEPTSAKIWKRLPDVSWT